MNRLVGRLGVDIECVTIFLVDVRLETSVVTLLLDMRGVGIFFVEGVLRVGSFRPTGFLRMYVFDFVAF
jgi:hypothetical protein